MIFIFRNLIKFYIFLTFILVFICIFFTPNLFKNITSNSISEEIFTLNPNGFLWPTPGYTKINSFFGKRSAPTAGASTFHKGIDIGAPEGASFIAVCDGEITFTNFLRWRWLYNYFNSG